LLDANVIFRAYENGFWEKLIDIVDVSVPASVANDEVLFTERGDQVEEIDLKELADEGKIEIVEATVAELASTIYKFDRMFAEGLDKGEREALALIDHGKVDDAHFCTTDGNAIIALAMLSRSEQGISFERVLQQFGLQQGRVRSEWTEKFFSEKIKEGQTNLIQGTGLRRD
jgi:hypothetical protein